MNSGSVAYLGFQKGGGGKFLLTTCAHIKGGGANQVFQFFSMSKKYFFAKGGHGRFGQGVNTPLLRVINSGTGATIQF